MTRQLMGTIEFFFCGFLFHHLLSCYSSRSVTTVTSGGQVIMFACLHRLSLRLMSIRRPDFGMMADRHWNDLDPV